ncbi:hypothetical protein BDN67DRAFT_985258 [Paxillus ammoniavirescens]|nr:hypothetical protein BDN67DRAFT_985258 [Paxillus ammoniavirescens]
MEVDGIEEGSAVDLVPKMLLSNSMLCEAIKSVHKQSVTNLVQKGDTSTRGSESVQLSVLVSYHFHIMLLLSEATLFFLNLTWDFSRSDAKNALASRVKNWASFVPTGKNVSHSSSVTSATVPPPSTSLSSADTTATSISYCLQGPPPTPDIPEDHKAQVGSFGDDEQDDTLECAAALLLSMKNGKPLITIHYPKADSIIKISNTALFIEVSKSNPSLKRKKPEPAVVYVLSSEVDEELEGADNEDDIQMDSITDDEWDLEEVGVKKTSVTAIIQNPTKKVKVKQPLEQFAGSQIASSQAGSFRPSTSSSRASVSLETTGDGPPADFFKQPTWRRELIPMLVLWAGAQCDVRKTSKQQIAEVLKLVMPIVYPNQPHLIGQLTTQSKAVSIMTTSLLLTRLSFLYEDLDTSCPEKAFRSQFVVQLLATTHLPAIQGFIHVPALDTVSLAHSGVKEIIGLCCAAVAFKFLFFSFLECALQLIRSGDISVSTDLGKGKASTCTPVRLNKASGKESTAACAFSEQNWGSASQKITAAARKCSAPQLWGIMELIREKLVIAWSLMMNMPSSRYGPHQHHSF